MVRVSVRETGVVVRVAQGDVLLMGKVARHCGEGAGVVGVEVECEEETEGEYGVLGRGTGEDDVDDVMVAGFGEGAVAAVVSEGYAVPGGIVAGDVGDECWPVACVEIWQLGNLYLAGGPGVGSWAFSF